MNPPEVSSSKGVKKQRRLSIQEKRIIIHVFHCLSRDHPCLKDEMIDMCADHTGVSKTSIYKILREEKMYGEVQAPKISSGRRKIEIDGAKYAMIRQAVHNFFFLNELPTLDKILEAVSMDETFPKIGKETLRKNLQKMNFKYGKVDKKSVLIEKFEIIAWRRNYLKRMNEFRKQGRKIYYLDEVNVDHTMNNVCHNEKGQNRQALIEDLSASIKIPTGKNSQLIVTHIGSDSGFITNGELICHSNKTGDYYGEMNAFIFEKWFSGIIEKVEPESVIVMDNAPYHSRKLEAQPQISWKKADIQEWLTRKGIPYTENNVKTELLQLIKVHATKFKNYAVDELASTHGITVLRLPPYHCELNPIHLIWMQLRDIVEQNRSVKLTDIESYVRGVIEKMTAEDWQNCIKHVETIEKNMWDLDIKVDETVSSFVSDVGDSDSSESESEMDVNAVREVSS